MSTLVRKAGTTDVSVVIRIVDSTTGAPETGVTFETSGIDLWYRREGAAVDAVAIGRDAGAELMAHLPAGYPVAG